MLTLLLASGLSLLTSDGSAREVPTYPGQDAVRLIKSAIDAYAAEVVLPSGIYKFGPDESLTLSRYKNLRIDGAGSTFLFNRRGKFSVVECKGLTIENITIDYDPLPFTQGTVAGVDEAEKCIQVRFDPDFSAPGDPGFPIQIKNGGEARGGIRFFNPAGDRMHAMLWEAATSIRDVGRAVYELTLQHGRLFRPGVQPGSLKAGDRFTLFPNSGMALEVSECEQITFNNINIYSAPGFGIGEHGGRGGNVFRNCRLIPKPGSGRLMSTNRDGFHSYMMKKGPLLEGCEIGYTADDAIAIHGFFSPVLRTAGLRELYILCLFGQNLDVGDVVSFYSLKDGRPQGSSTVLSLEKLSRVDGQRELSAWQAARAEARLAGGRSIPANEWVVIKAQLDQDVAGEEFMLADSKTFSGAGAEIRGCHVHDSASRGLLIRSPGTKIIGNRIERTVLAPVALMPERYWLESSFLDGVEIADNSVIDAPLPGLDTRHFDYGFAAIQVSSIFGARYFNPPEFTPWRQNRDIRILNNRIVRPSGPAIAVLNAEDVVISGNRIEAPFAAGISGNPLNLLRTLAPSGPVPTPEQSEVAAKPWYGILLMATRTAKVTDNTTAATTPEVLGTAGVGPWSEDIYIK
ncbi:hypothetical protein OPIT5_12135 [Opitutaceae bacterium TAV5]|nr:hypothetical protein OPIT5_12135 [Opitutaceae bacterium TAV5]